MSRRSGAAALAVTITVTVAVTVMTIALNPSRGDSYSSQVLEKGSHIPLRPFLNLLRQILKYCGKRISWPRRCLKYSLQIPLS